MRNFIFLKLFVLTLVIMGCQGSEVYRGKWKALNSEGIQYTIEFTEEQMIVTRDSSDTETWKYAQNSVHISNRNREYGIRLDNGLSYKILFPIKDNQDKGAITDQNGQIIFTIGRNEFYTYQDVFGLN